MYFSKFILLEYIILNLSFMLDFISSKRWFFPVIGPSDMLSHWLAQNVWILPSIK